MRSQKSTSVQFGASTGVTMPERKILVLMDYGRGLSSWRQRYAQGKVSEPVPYGYAVDSKDWRLGFSEDSRESKLLNVVRRGLIRWLGFDLVHVWRSVSAAKEVDVVWTHTEHIHIGYTCLRVFMPRLPPAICQSVWLPEEHETSPVVKRTLASFALKRSAINVTNSEANLGDVKRIAPDRPAAYVEFGISPEKFLAIPERQRGGKLRVLAVGNDRHRDWRTLISAAQDLVDDAEFLILSRRSIDSPLPPNVSQVLDSDFHGILQAYEWSDVVCLPLSHNKHSSGLTVALEATYARRPLLISNVGGLETYFPELSSFGVSAAADSTTWSEAIRGVLSDYDRVSAAMVAAATADAARSELTSRGYSRRLLELSAQLVEPPIEHQKPDDK
jgi:glycosyltransferase involved in cell wall biosynthesis